MHLRSLLLLAIILGFQANAHSQETTATETVAADEAIQAKPFDEAMAMKIMERFAGRWLGTYQILSVDGQVIQKMEAEITYNWSITPKAKILKGRAVYAAENGMGIANSETFIENDMVVSMVEQSGKTRVYRGLVGELGKSITWSPLDRTTTLDESLRQVFEVNGEGTDILKTNGYENVQREGLEVMLVIRGELVRQPLQQTKDGPVHDY